MEEVKPIEKKVEIEVGEHPTLEPMVKDDKGNTLLQQQVGVFSLHKKEVKKE